MFLKALSSKALIDLITPGSRAYAQQIQWAVQQVEALGLQARVLSAKDKPLLKAVDASDWSRFQQLKQALMAKDSQAIWCIRGGYGCQRLLPFLLSMPPPARPKLFIGYSDATVLHIFLNEKWKWPTLHFPVLIDLRKAVQSTVKRFCHLVQPSSVQQKKQKTSINKVFQTGVYLDRLRLWNPASVFKKREKMKTLSGFLTGGNMTVIQSSIGTAWAGKFQHRFLFLEDVGEAPYRVDRSLWQMQHAGVFKGVRAILIGDFISSQSSKQAMRQVLRSFASRMSCPVVGGLPCGHGPKNHPLPFMTKSELQLQSSGQVGLSIQSPFRG